MEIEWLLKRKVHYGRFVKAASKVVLLRTKFQSLQISSFKAYGQLGFHYCVGVALAGMSQEALLPQEQLQLTDVARSKLPT